MKTILSQAILKLQEVSRDPSDFKDLSGSALAETLREYWSEHGLTTQDCKFLEKLSVY